MKTIKVKETKNHRAGKLNWSADNRELIFEEAIVPVAEAKLVLIECKSEEALFYIVHDFQDKKFDRILLYHEQVKGLGKYYKPILISETEGIEKHDSFLNLKSNRIFVNDMGLEISNETEKKIITLPEHFSPKLLQDIVDGKLKEGDRVLVECEVDRDDERNWYKDVPSGKYWEDEPAVPNKDNLYSNAKYHQIKLNSSGHITLHKLEEKMYSEEQLREAMRASLGFSSYREIDIYISKL